jgi:hypothetical protein
LQIALELKLSDMTKEKDEKDKGHKTELKNIEDIRNQEIMLLKEVHDGK